MLVWNILSDTISNQSRNHLMALSEISVIDPVFRPSRNYIPELNSRVFNNYIRDHIKWNG